MSTQLLDTIETKDGRKFTGIIDFISKKNLYFFDFTNEPEVDYLTLAILWKGNSPHLRFSVFCTIEFPNVNLPRAILLSTSMIEYSSVPLEQTKKPKQRKTVIRLES